MATNNKPSGGNTHKGAARKRSQLKVEAAGEDRWTKRNKSTGALKAIYLYIDPNAFMAQKKTAKKFQGRSAGAVAQKKKPLPRHATRALRRSRSTSEEDEDCRRERTVAGYIAGVKWYGVSVRIAAGRPRRQRRCQISRHRVVDRSARAELAASLFRPYGRPFVIH
jgi:hypothetical protein